MNTELKQKQILKRITKPIRKLIDDNTIANFDIKTKGNIDYFSFDISYPIPSGTHLISLYNISGTLIKTNTENNMIYVIKFPEDNKIIRTYINKTTKLDNDLYLKELSHINHTFTKNKIDAVYITKEHEKILINPNSELYKLYQSKQIDILTFTNLALLQATNTNEFQTKKGIIKDLCPKYKLNS